MAGERAADPATASRAPDELTLRRFATGEAFLARAQSFLLRNEAAHNLLLSIRPTYEVPAPAEPAPCLLTVEWGGEVLAAAALTPPYNLVLSLTDDPAAVDAIAADLARSHPSMPGVLAPRPLARAFAQRWRDLTGRPFTLAMAQRIYQLDAVIPVVGAPGELRRATEADRELLTAWARAFAIEAEGDDDPRAAERLLGARLDRPDAGSYLWHDRQPVALVGYRGPTPHGIRVGPVYTPPEYRRHGYAGAATAALSQRLLDAGYRHCFLFTDLANPTSNRIYQAIGYRPVCDMEVYRFAAG